MAGRWFLRGLATLAAFWSDSTHGGKMRGQTGLAPLFSPDVDAKGR